MTIGALVVLALSLLGWRGPVYEVYFGEVPESLPGASGAWAFPVSPPHECIIGFPVNSSPGIMLVVHEVLHCLGLSHEDMGSHGVMIRDVYDPATKEITTVTQVDRELMLALYEARPELPHRVTVPGLSR